VVVGMGINADWASDEFPSELAHGMTSLRALGGRRIDTAALFEAFTAAIEPQIEQLRNGEFDGAGWTERQLTNGRLVRLVGHDAHDEVVRAVRVDSATGALLVEDELGSGVERVVVSGEIRHLRLDSSV
jgi:biotin-(acetyl-CoA carboxylase) ligase